MKKVFLKVGFYANIILYLSYFVLVFAVLFHLQNVESFIYSPIFNSIKTIISLIVLIFWIYNLILWSKHDKKIGNFLLLFFLIGIYTPFYYLKAVRNNWI